MSTQGKVAIITGASQGIGAGLVQGFLELGYRVVANSRSIRQNGHANLLAVAGDISQPETAGRLVETALSQFGRIDTLVNNAGVFVSKPFTEFTEEDFSLNLSVNVAGFFHVTQRAARAMLEQGSGHIVTITTSIADQPIAKVPAALAALTKGGLDAVTKSLAIEFAAAGLRVNAVSPGVIQTPMHRPETHEFLASLHPMRRMGSIQEVVEAVLYLETASFVTGEILHVDGGQNAGVW